MARTSVSRKSQRETTVFEFVPFLVRRVLGWRVGPRGVLLSRTSPNGVLTVVHRLRDGCTGEIVERRIAQLRPDPARLPALLEERQRPVDDLLRRPGRHVRRIAIRLSARDLAGSFQLLLGLSLDQNTRRSAFALRARRRSRPSLLSAASLLAVGCERARRVPRIDAELVGWPRPYQGVSGLELHVFSTGSLSLPRGLLFYGGSWIEQPDDRRSGLRYPSPERRRGRIRFGLQRSSARRSERLPRVFRLARRLVRDGARPGSARRRWRPRASTPRR